jgi:hypothetical protein
MTADSLIGQLLNGDTSQYRPTKKKDSNDHSLGTLSEMMQKCWAGIKQLEGPLEEALQTFSDRLSVYDTEVEQFGDKMSHEVSKSHSTAFRELLDKIIELAKPYKILHSFFFCDLLREEYGKAAKEQGKPIIGIREGFEVVCRNTDNRKDTASVIDPYKDELARFSGCDCVRMKEACIAILMPVFRADGSKTPSGPEEPAT